MRRLLLIAFILGLLTTTVSTASAARRWSRFRSGSNGSSASTTTPRPATGFGANIHRRYIIEQELKRASQGKSVRSRGNILWRR